MSYLKTSTGTPLVRCIAGSRIYWALSTLSQLENCWLRSILPSNCRSTKFFGISNQLKGNYFAWKVSQLFMLITKFFKKMVEISCTICLIMRFDQVSNDKSLIFGVESCYDLDSY